MKVVLGYHFRPEKLNESERSAIFDIIKPELDMMYPWDAVYVADSGHTPYNRAASRNLIVQRALEDGADIVVVADADGLPRPAVLASCINEASDGRLHIPFDEVRVIHYRRFLHHHHRYRSLRPTHKYGPSCGGIYVIQPSRWVFMGGQDERVVGYGFEDQICLVAANTFLHKPVYHPGTLYNVDHARSRLTDLQETPRPDYEAAFQQNVALVDKYHLHQGNRSEIREVSRGSNCWTGGTASSPDYLRSVTRTTKGAVFVHSELATSDDS